MYWHPLMAQTFRVSYTLACSAGLHFYTEALKRARQRVRTTVTVSNHVAIENAYDSYSVVQPVAISYTFHQHGKESILSTYSMCAYQ